MLFPFRSHVRSPGGSEFFARRAKAISLRVMLFVEKALYNKSARLVS